MALLGFGEPISEQIENLPDLSICIILPSSGPVLAVHKFRKSSKIMF